MTSQQQARLKPRERGRERQRRRYTLSLLEVAFTIRSSGAADGMFRAPRAGKLAKAN